MDDYDKWVEAGRIAATARDLGASMIKKGARLYDVAEAAENKIRDMGAECAFPANVSLNEVAAHYSPFPDDDKVFGDDVVKLDCGAMLDGCIGDTAVTIDLSGKYSELLAANQKALDDALAIIRPGVTLGEIGRAIHSAITAAGFAPITNLSGHGLSRYKQHDKPSIPNFDTGSTEQLVEDQTIAVEPFATTGAGKITETSNASIFSKVESRPTRNMIARQALKIIDRFNGMPFSVRWLAKEMGSAKARLATNILVREKILYDYTPLPDMQKGIVSQFEHSVIVREDPVVTTRI